MHLSTAIGCFESLIRPTLHLAIFQEKTDKEQIELEEKEDEDKDSKKKKKEKKPKEKKPKEPKGPTKIDMMTTHLDLKERDEKDINTEIDVSNAANHNQNLF